MKTTVSVEPNYARIFDYLIYEAKCQRPARYRSELLIEMLEYGKRLHLASVEVIAIQRAASKEMRESI